MALILCDCVVIRQGETQTQRRSHMKMKTDIEGMQSQVQGLLEPSEAGKDRNRLSPAVSGGTSPAHPWIFAPKGSLVRAATVILCRRKTEPGGLWGKGLGAEKPTRAKAMQRKEQEKSPGRGCQQERQLTQGSGSLGLTLTEPRRASPPLGRGHSQKMPSHSLAVTHQCHSPH